MSEIINLSNKKVIEVVLNSKEVEFSLGLKNIDHLQKTYKMPYVEMLNKMQEGDLNVVLKLIYSMATDKKTGKILGEKFFKDFNEFSILNNLTPVVQQLISEDMPEAKDDSEKK